MCGYGQSFFALYHAVPVSQSSHRGICSASPSSIVFNQRGEVRLQRSGWSRGVVVERYSGSRWVVQFLYLE